MAQKTVSLPVIGELTLSKRRGTRSLRLSVSASGRVRVGMPTWVPYAAGIRFAQERQEWVLKHLTTHQPRPLTSGGRVGKSYRLEIRRDPSAARTRTRLAKNTILVISPHNPEDTSVQKAARAASERALKKEAERLLPIRLAKLASDNSFRYSGLKIKKLTSRWGSCSSHGLITLNFFLMQLPWDLIDYVLVHELVHTKHLNHGAAFWSDFEKAYPGAKQARRRIRDYKPVINTIDSDVA